jgi:membrane protein implicated in regulation of membrane protease activity
MTLLWWHWLALGLILVGLEMAASGGFYVIFFGIAAIAIAGLRLLDIGGPVWVQFLLFSVLSVGSLLLFRTPLLRWLQLDGQGAAIDSLVGETAMPLEDIAARAVGRAELRGTVWTARNAVDRPLLRGQRCVVVAVDQFMIILEPEGVRA